MAQGSLALVGSGEYLPSMQDLEHSLIADGVAAGKKPRFVQLATAAGREGPDRLEYWRDLGAQQGARLDVEVDFIPLFSQEDAHDEALAQRIGEPALIYFSGGDPHYLADVMRGSTVWKAIAASVRTGSSLAGCSAGAMFLSSLVPSLRFLRRDPVTGMGVIDGLQVIPHFDVIHRWVPDAAVRALTSIPEGVLLVGIEEETAMVHRQGAWSPWGRGSVHLLNGVAAGRYHDALPSILPAPAF